MSGGSRFLSWWLGNRPAEFKRCWEEHRPCFTDPLRLQSLWASGGSEGVLGRRGSILKSKKNWARWRVYSQGCCCPWSLGADLSTSLLYEVGEASREICWDIAETHPDILLPWDSLSRTLELFFKQTGDILPLRRSTFCLVWETKLSLA